MKRGTWLAIASVVAVGCSVGSGTRPPPRGDGSLPPGTDGGPRADGSLPPVNACAPGCGPEESCGDGEGNGLDDNCDGQVDEGCQCSASGVTRPCFAGPPDRRNVGACADGIETCSEFLTWGPCSGGVSPTAEVCDGADNDCNAISDDVPGCTSDVVCPGNDLTPPLSTYTLRGSRVTTAQPATAYRWTIGCPASVPAALCPSPANPNAETTEVYFTASGAYRVGVTMTLQDGTEASCGWTVYVQGTGLRVELNWDTMLASEGGTDVDLHLHRWTRNGVDTDFYDDVDDCYFANCQPDDEIAWTGHADSPLENCADAPHGGGADWSDRGACRNPRLDVDTNGTDGACEDSETDPNSDAFCAPENINVDNPIVGQPYRVMVNYYNDSGHSGVTYPTVNIYCGGALRGSFGNDPFVELRNGSDYGELNDNWYVADVVFFEGTCGMDCMVYPLGMVVQGEPDPLDPFGFIGVVPFGPAWSCDYDAASGRCE
jgi:hypothetical protein